MAEVNGPTVIQLYADIRRLNEVIARCSAAGRVVALLSAQRELRAAEDELIGRIRAMVDSGERMPEHFTEVGPATPGWQAEACPTTAVQ